MDADLSVEGSILDVLEANPIDQNNAIKVN